MSGSAEPVQLGRNFAVASWLRVPSPSQLVSAPSPVSAGQSSAHFPACGAAPRGFWELCSLLPLLGNFYLKFKVVSSSVYSFSLPPPLSNLRVCSLQGHSLVLILLSSCLSGSGLLVDSDQIARLFAHVLNQLTLNPARKVHLLTVDIKGDSSLPLQGRGRQTFFHVVEVRYFQRTSQG